MLFHFITLHRLKCVFLWSWSFSIVEDSCQITKDTYSWRNFVYIGSLEVVLRWKSLKRCTYRNIYSSIAPENYNLLYSDHLSISILKAIALLYYAMIVLGLLNIWVGENFTQFHTIWLIIIDMKLHIMDLLELSLHCSIRTSTSSITIVTTQFLKTSHFTVCTVNFTLSVIQRIPIVEQ